MSLRVNKIGSDPEVFVRDVRNTLIPAANLIPNGKGSPMCGPGGCAIHWDNVLAELNPAPATNEQEFVQNTRECLDFLHSIIGQEHGVDYSISRELQGDTLRHPSAWEMGCDPDFDAWGIEQYKKPKHSEIGPFRHAGGHLHFSLQQSGDKDLRLGFIRALDLCLGIPSVLEEEPNCRRPAYGRAGRYRPTEYGIEYRTPSNFWLRSQGFQASAIWAMVDRARAMVEKHEGAILEAGTDIRNAINNADKKLARRLVSDFNLQTF